MTELPKLKVLFATYPWAFETPGGGEMQLMKYAKHLPSHGVDVQLHDPWRANLTDVSVVHYFSCMGGSVHFCAQVKNRGLPLVVSSSLWITDETRHLYPVDEIRNQLSLADVIVTNSEVESDQLATVLKLPRNHFSAVFNGVEPDFASTGPQPFRDQSKISGPFVLNVANIEPRKNQLNMVRAMKNLSVPLVLIGAVRDKAYAEAVFREAGSQLRYLGAMEHGDPALASAFAACSAFGLPSTLETPGLAALEAAACGANIVVTSEGSTREYFGSQAHYVDHRDPGDIRAGIERALADRPDPALRRRVNSQFAWMTVTAALVDVYRAAQSRNRAGGPHG
jgi:glycosyltransferase involved in cell wall biosynthesis